MANGGEMVKSLSALSKVLKTGADARRGACPLLLLLATCVVWGQTDWPSFGHDPGASRFAPLKQINSGNISRLQRAWTFHTGKPGSEAVPIVVGGVMYLAG